MGTAEFVVILLSAALGALAGHSLIMLWVVKRRDTVTVSMFVGSILALAVLWGIAL